MKPINQAVWQAANTAESAGRFNRASGERPSPTGRGPRDTDIHQARQGGPRPHAWSEQGPRLHRCIMESRGGREREVKVRLRCNCLSKIENTSGLVCFPPFLSQIVEVKGVMSSSAGRPERLWFRLFFLCLYLLVRWADFLHIMKLTTSEDDTDLAATLSPVSEQILSPGAMHLMPSVNVCHQLVFHYRVLSFSA